MSSAPTSSVEVAVSAELLSEQTRPIHLTVVCLETSTSSRSLNSSAYSAAWSRTSLRQISCPTSNKRSAATHDFWNNVSCIKCSLSSNALLAFSTCAIFTSCRLAEFQLTSLINVALPNVHTTVQDASDWLPIQTQSSNCDRNRRFNRHLHHPRIQWRISVGSRWLRNGGRCRFLRLRYKNRKRKNRFRMSEPDWIRFEVTYKGLVGS